MDELHVAILEKIREHNIEGDKIYWKRLTEIFHGVASNPTIHKKVRQLVEEGEIVERMVQSGHGVYKYLYIPGFEEKTYDSEKLDMILRTQEEILYLIRNMLR